VIPARRNPAPAPAPAGEPVRPPVATLGGCGGKLQAGFRCGDLRATPPSSPSWWRWTPMPDGQLRTLCDACHARPGASSGAGGPAEAERGNDDQGDGEAVA